MIHRDLPWREEFGVGKPASEECSHTIIEEPVQIEETGESLLAHRGRVSGRRGTAVSKGVLSDSSGLRRTEPNCRGGCGPLEISSSLQAAHVQDPNEIRCLVPLLTYSLHPLLGNPWTTLHAFIASTIVCAMGFGLLTRSAPLRTCLAGHIWTAAVPVCRYGMKLIETIRQRDL